MKRLVILAPNWLGDAVMALPAIDDLRRGLPAVEFGVAARPAIAPLFRLVPGIASVTTVERGWRGAARQLSAQGFDTAVLLPNSLHAAVVAARAGIPERWGYRTDWRGPLLTKSAAPPAAVHQAAYYQHLVRALGFETGPQEPRLSVAANVIALASALVGERTAPLVAIAPGAAFGGAKRWAPERFAALAADLAADGVYTVMIGSGADRPTGEQILAALPANHRVIDLMGRTDLAQLAGVLVRCRALVTNDSGAMHLAAALGTPVTAVFGPTDEDATRPLGAQHVVITGDAWCRPCLLRECPLDHRCMRSIEVAPVLASARKAIAA